MIGFHADIGQRRVCMVKIEGLPGVCARRLPATGPPDRRIACGSGFDRAVGLRHPASKGRRVDLPRGVGRMGIRRTCSEKLSMRRPGKDITDELGRMDLFTALDAQQLQVVIESTRVIRLDDGERLFDHGQPARQFFHLRAGQLKLFRSSPSGSEKIIEIIQARETFAQAVMFMEPSGGYPVSAEALEPSVVLGFDNEVVRGVLRGSVDTCFRVLASMSYRLRQQVDEIDRLTLHPAVSRLAGYLVAQTSSEVPRYRQAPGVHLTAPKNVIASRLGIQPETFSRVAARLVKNGLIRVQGQDVVLLDVEGLRACAED